MTDDMLRLRERREARPIPSHRPAGSKFPPFLGTLVTPATAGNFFVVAPVRLYGTEMEGYRARTFRLPGMVYPVLLSGFGRAGQTARVEWSGDRWEARKIGTYVADALSNCCGGIGPVNIPGNLTATRLTDGATIPLTWYPAGSNWTFDTSLNPTDAWIGAAMLTDQAADCATSMAGGGPTPIPHRVTLNCYQPGTGSQWEIWDHFPQCQNPPTNTGPMPGQTIPANFATVDLLFGANTGGGGAPTGLANCDPPFFQIGTLGGSGWVITL